MGRLPQSKILEVKRASDIVQVIQDYVPLTRQGREFVGRCPFHDDRRPSLRVSPDFQYFRCWVCDNVRGSVIDFVQLAESLDFREAIQLLAQRAGIPLEVEPPRPRAKGQLDRDSIHDVVQWAKTFFVNALSGSPAADYLGRRGVPAESVKRFEIGYAPGGWDALLTAGVKRWGSIEPLIQAGLVVRRDDDPSRVRTYDVFRHRVTFPIHDARGRPLGFGARALGDEEGTPKYINTPATEIYHKDQVLFALNLARTAIRESHQALVMEGYTDVIAAHEHGFRNAVAVCGVALTAGHLRELRVADEILLIFDGDAAGLRSAEARVPTLLDANAGARIVLLPGGSDPDDFLKEHGAEAFRELLATGQPPFAFKRKRIAERYDLTDPIERRRASTEFIEVLAAVHDETLRATLAVEVATLLATDEVTLRRELARLRERRDPARRERGREVDVATGSGRATGSAPTAGATAWQGRLLDGDELEKCVLACALAEPELLADVERAFELPFFPEGPFRRVATALYDFGHDLGRVGSETEATTLLSDLRTCLDEEAAALLDRIVDQHLAEVLFAPEPPPLPASATSDPTRRRTPLRDRLSFDALLEECVRKRRERELARDKAQHRRSIAGTAAPGSALSPDEIRLLNEQLAREREVRLGHKPEHTADASGNN